MEDIINALLDVVRAQHTATQGTDEAPFNMDDIVDMAMNIIGRPDEPESEAEMIETIENMVEELAPDIFPPKTFEQLNDSERAISAANMIQESLFGDARGKRREEEAATRQQEEISSSAYSYEEEEEEPAAEQDPAKLNDLIYQNLMDMMGLKDPQIEYPFDRSQIRYGKEKSFTEQLEENEANDQEEERNRKLSAWELAQNVIDKDEKIRQKEPYIPQVAEEPKTKSASQLAAEAIAKSQEESKMQMEIERRAEALMAEAKKRGQDPMAFALHQQEILRYMEKNSDELVSFEDYEDLSPEEKLEIERQIQREKELEAGVSPEDLTNEVPEEYVPEELKEKAALEEAPKASETLDSSAKQQTQNTPPVFTEEMLRKLSQEVIKENSDMILAEDSEEDMEGLNEAIMANIMQMMSGSGVKPQQEDVDELLDQAAKNTLQPQPSSQSEEKQPQRKEMKSAVELAKEAQARESAKKMPEPVLEEDLSELADSFEEDLSELDDLDDLENLEDGEETADHSEIAKEDAAEEEKGEPTAGKKEKEEQAPVGEPDKESGDEKEADAEAGGAEKSADEKEADAEAGGAEKSGDETESDEEIEGEKEPEAEDEEYEYVDPDELVLGEHTQAEIDEAMENLATLGLEGEVYERAKRMLLLELAGSEAELDAWLAEQENGKKKKANTTSLEEEDDALDFDEDELEQELESALDEEFLLDEEEDETEEEDGDGALDDAEDQAEDEAEHEVEDEAEPGADVSAEEEETENKAETELGAETEPRVYVESEHIAAETVRREAFYNSKNIRTKRNVVKKKEKASEQKAERTAETVENRAAQSKEYQVSVRNPFTLKNSASYMDKFEEYIVETQENRKLSTGFKRLDGMLRYGLHKGSYFIDAVPQYLKNSFMQQMADRAAESGVDVLYISTELSRYELMTDTISRLSYEMNGKNSSKAVSVMSIMTGEDGASLDSLKDEMNWYRGRISEHLFILDQEAVDEVIDSMGEASGGEVLSEIIRSIVRDGAHKPVVFIDNIENILSVEDSVDMEPLMRGIRVLAKELSIPIVMSYGYAQAESQEERSLAEDEFNHSLGNMCDVYMELQYAPMVTEDGMELTPEDIHEMVEDGDTILVDILLHRNRRNMRASCQIMATPQFNFFEE